jgi:nitrite reductase/ring-hydroxylating ferredoxin subunit
MGVMIDRDAHMVGPDKFVPVLAMDQLPDNTPVRVDAQGRPVLLVRRGEEVYAIGAVCSHYGGPLEEGQLKDGTIECPWHASRFCLADGRVDAGPATASVPAYEVRIRNHEIEVKAK